MGGIFSEIWFGLKVLLAVIITISIRSSICLIFSATQIPSLSDGMATSKKIQAYCMKNNIKAWSGGMLETGIGRAFNIHLQTLPGFVLPGDTSETSRYFTEDIVDKPVILEPDGFIEIPKGAGIGVNLLPERLNRFKVFHQKII